MLSFEGVREMAVEDFDSRKKSSAAWLYVPIVLILFVGGALSVAAYHYEPGLTIAEALVAGFGGLAAMIVGLFAALFGVVLGLVGALFGLAVGGGAIILTLFIVASPVLAIILFILLMRRPKTCPVPGAEEPTSE